MMYDVPVENKGSTTDREIRRKFSQTLRERERSSKDICAKIRSSFGRARAAAWEEKRAFGADTRWILLASGFTKGMPYKAIELKTGEFNSAWPHPIQIAAKEVAELDIPGETLSSWLASTGEFLVGFTALEKLPEDSNRDTSPGFTEQEQQEVKDAFDARRPELAEPPEVKKGFFARIFGWALL